MQKLENCSVTGMLAVSWSFIYPKYIRDLRVSGPDFWRYWFLKILKIWHHSDHWIKLHQNYRISLREKSLYSEFSWSVFSHVLTEYGEIRSLNAGKYGPEKSEYGHFSRSVYSKKLYYYPRMFYIKGSSTNTNIVIQILFLMVGFRNCRSQ